MTSSARHNGRVRLTARVDAIANRAMPPSSKKRRSSNLTWVVAACACLTAFVVKMSQQWLIRADETNAYAELSSTFDWVAILLCICALALVAIQGLAETETKSDASRTRDAITTASGHSHGNLALPARDDQRLRLAQSLSHELRTPLNAVIGFTDLMNHQLHGNLGHPKYNEYCAHISESSQNLLRAVDDILALNANHPHDISRRVPLPIARALHEAWEESISKSEPSEPSPRFSISGDPAPKVIADPDILSHALKNIVETLHRHAATDAPISAVIRHETDSTHIYCHAEIDRRKIVETAPLDTTPSTRTERPTRHTLTEAAAQALVHAMDGHLVIRQPEDTNNLEIICILPAPRNENTPRESTSAVA